VTVDVEEPELIGTIELASQIRESTSQLISIENPTDVEVTINNTDFHCDNEYIQITPPKLVIPPRTERAFEVHYRPLVSSGVQNVNLILHHAVLGDYKH
jgi:P pilus assembly chaperone PapD